VNIYGISSYHITVCIVSQYVAGMITAAVNVVVKLISYNIQQKFNRYVKLNVSVKSFEYLEAFSN